MKIGKACKVAYQELFFPFPLSNREIIVYGFGANRMYTNGTILVMAKSVSLITDPIVRDKIGEINNPKKKEGLVENLVHFYGFEISPVSADEVSLRVIMLVDPRIPVIPDSLINFGTKQLGEEMVQKLLKFSKDLKGTKYETAIKDSENANFYNWIKGYISRYCDEKGWLYSFPEF